MLLFIDHVFKKSKNPFHLFYGVKKAMTIGFSLLFLFSCDDSGFRITPATFTEEYKNANNQQFTIEVPEVQELVHIIMAITDEGKSNPDFVEKSTPYYSSVLKQFDTFKNEKIVQVLNEKLKGNRKMSGYGAYARYKMDACGYYFKDDQILKEKSYAQMNWDNTNYLDDCIQDLEGFARKSGFQNFYNSNRAYYENEKMKANKQLQIDKQWKWLERRFSTRYNHTRVIFSPLVNGSHSTNRFEGNGFKQAVVFINGPFMISGGLYRELTDEDIYNRILFTELDHNYVNPITEKYKKEIGKIFSNKKVWALGKGASDYNSGYSIFNEYMTWAVFSLYAYESLPQERVDEIISKTTKQMEVNRGFNRFNSFNKKLQELYNLQNVKNIESLYEPMIEWSKNQ